MPQNFTLELSAPDKDFLLSIAKLSISRALKGSFDEAALPVPESSVLSAPLGAFVTLKKEGRLRGCIGRLQEEAPLYLTVSRMALAAAFNDPRFPALQSGEFAELEFDISIMGPITACREPENVVIGRHGLIMKQGNRQGLLLPQVPVEWNWNREEFLAATCNKAGLQQNAWQQAWKQDGVELYWFEAVVI
ncbi:AmmeMemoRadiSam system protein A [Desulfovibrio sp. OttesenSCG-928-C06]|nr:AmmeMemoRadiSam system protein A [Desulfovibrio sp. OttesenSCG-928-C06]